jgi:hypothetical protein
MDNINKDANTFSIVQEFTIRSYRLHTFYTIGIYTGEQDQKITRKGV